MLIILLFQQTFQGSVQLHVIELEPDKTCHEFCKVSS